MNPKVLLVETGHSPLVNDKDGWWTDVLDYQIYETVPTWWRRIEEFLRLDIVLALRARRIAHQYDVVWANSERAGIVLAGINKPLVVLVHHMASRKKKLVLRLAGIARKWTAIGYLTNADRDFMVSYYGVSDARFIKVVCQDLAQFTPPEPVFDGPILSLGASKRDYVTLVESLMELPNYVTEIYAGSRFEGFYPQSAVRTLPDWVRFYDPIPSQETPALYARARFVVLPLKNTTQFSAGMTSALEASAAGKAVIATNLPGMSSYIQDGVTGILVPPHDHAAMRDAIHKLWTQPELAHQMGVAGRKYIEAEFNPLIVNDKIRKFLADVYAESQQFR
ncbi:MAG: glycosyltransferase family 4 protein [Chloroflexota bacterium]